MFEHYQFEGVYISVQAVLSLYAQGKLFFFMFFRVFFEELYNTVSILIIINHLVNIGGLSSGGGAIRGEGVALGGVWKG